jgi:hypothetical protein
MSADPPPLTALSPTTYTVPDGKRSEFSERGLVAERSIEDAAGHDAAKLPVYTTFVPVGVGRVPCRW